jgi:hypothetical protein
VPPTGGAARPALLAVTAAEAAGLALAAAGPSLGYAVGIHELFPERVLAREGELAAERLQPVTGADLAAFRDWLDGLFRAHPDAAAAAEYRRRWPSRARFDSAAFKTLMGLNAARRLNGFDIAEGLPCTALSALCRGSGQPDTDWRNRERLALDAAGRPIRLPDGREVPADPIVLNMGNARGLSSQAHAHYGLPDVPLSADPDVLRDDPRRFAMPAGWPRGPVRALAREYCQLHFDLAVLAALWGRPAGRSLAHLFLGHAMHYLGDVANQIHTVQVGYAGFFVTAHWLLLERRLLTLGGYLGESKPFAAIGIDLLTTHHVVSEALNEKRIREALAGRSVPAPVRAALGGLESGDPTFQHDLEAALARLRPVEYDPCAGVITGRMIEHSSREGSDVYRHMAGAMSPRMSRYGVLVDDERHDPDTMLADASDPAVAAHLESLYRLHARAFARVGTAFRLLHSRFRAASQPAPQAPASAPGRPGEAGPHPPVRADLEVRGRRPLLAPRGAGRPGEAGPAVGAASAAAIGERSLRSRARRSRALRSRAGDTARAARAAAFAAALLSSRLAELAAAEARLRAYLEDPPATGHRTVREPGWLVGPPAAALGLAAGLRWWWRRRRRRCRTGAGATVPAPGS